MKTHSKGPAVKQNPPLRKRIKGFLPSRSYLKIYFWMLFMFSLVLAALSWLFGRYLGFRNALVGGLAIGAIVLAVFLAALGAGVLLHIIDREG